MQPLNANSLVLWYQNSSGASGQFYESKNGVADYKSLSLAAFDLISRCGRFLPRWCSAASLA